MFSSSASQAGGGGLAVEGVFAVTTYTGNSTSRTVATGLDLSTPGGSALLVTRTDAGSPGFVRALCPPKINTSSSAAPTGYFFDYNATGLVLSGDALNATGNTYVAYSFAQAAGFFDRLDYTGDGTPFQSTPHLLGSLPGMVIVRRQDDAGDWLVYHRAASGANNAVAKLNTTGAFVSQEAGGWNVTDTHFSPDFDIAQLTNINGGSYYACLFGHDPGGVVQCSGFTTDVSGNGSFNHGWSAGTQFVLLKAANASGDWEVFDRTRTPGWTGSDARSLLNTGATENTVSRLSESGTTLSFAGLSASTDYIFMIIRAPA